eukprot:TRINITY_DN23292_c0_g2_i2.p1 TRINITY_DN23292_c0_g2~~TRINITY_DN23292_c0_g2_i2.p1  ORF type:complete len:555 (+),score=107.57 TRINITY_DN23292_c0_g2_i2:69-1733(+)
MQASGSAGSPSAGSPSGDLRYIRDLSVADKISLVRSECATALAEDAKLLQSFKAAIKAYSEAVEHCAFTSENSPEWPTADVQQSFERKIASLEAGAEALLSAPLPPSLNVSVEDHAVRLYTNAALATTKFAAGLQVEEHADLVARRVSEFGQAAASSLESAFTSFWNGDTWGPMVDASVSPGPVGLIRVQRRGSATFRCAVAEMQGHRLTHEDAHAMLCGSNTGDFWVLDGHGSDRAALFGAPALARELGSQLQEDGELPSRERIQEAFERVDDALRVDLASHPRPAGSTVLGALCKRQGDLYSVTLMNCGDSRAVVCRGPSAASSSSADVKMPEHIADGATPPPERRPPVIVQTVDHKPNLPVERHRIYAAGGVVSTTYPARLDGIIAVSRAIGDFMFKARSDLPPSAQKVTCLPDTFEISGLEHGDFLLLACDGVWDVLTSDAAAAFIRSALLKDARVDLGKVAADLVTASFQKGSFDNITVMIVQFADGSDWSAFPDEMLGFEKYNAEANSMPASVHTRHVDFLKKCKFPLLPPANGTRWLKSGKGPGGRS